MSEDTTTFFKNVVTLGVAIVTALGSLKMIPSESVDPLVKFITEGVVALGGVIVTGAVLWKQMSHKEALKDDALEEQKMKLDAKILAER